MIIESRAQKTRNDVDTSSLPTTLPQTTHDHSAAQEGYSSFYSGFYNDLPSSTTGLQTPPTSIPAAIVRVEPPTSSTRSRQFMQRMESAVQLFGQLIAKGQHDQALLVKQESESIKIEMAQYYENLHAEIAKNTNLQNQVKQMVAAAETMTKRILKLQEAQMDNDKRVMAKLALIQSKATAILTQTYELHEFPIPRLFIILPKEDITKREKISTLFVQRFRLYFLCECGEHTRPVDGPPSSLSHDIHLARHEGYDLDRPNEFFRKYGPYVLALLQMLKYGVATAGMVVPPLSTLKVADELAFAEAGLKAFEKGLAPRVDSAIEYLQRLTASQDEISKDLRDEGSRSNLMDPVSISRLEGLEGADLRHLGSFLKASDEGKVLGNLYRTMTPKGHVKWVCLDHYRDSYGAVTFQEFKETVELNGGTYDQQTGRVTMRLASPVLANQFYTMLLSTRLVHELELTLEWNTAFEDLRILKGVIQQSNVFHLSLDLSGKTGPTADFVYRNRRAEPIVQIMASGKVHTIALKNTTAFLSQTKELLKTTLHIRHFDLGEIIGTTDDFVKLEKLIHASPTLTRLGVVVGDIDGAFARLKPIVARHKALSILDLTLRDGTAASVLFEQGSDKISTIGLRMINPGEIILMNMPMVTSVAFLGEYTPSRASDLVQSAIKDHRHLEVVEIIQLPDGTEALFQDLLQAIEAYALEVEIKKALEDTEFFMEDTTSTMAAMASSERTVLGSKFSELQSRHMQSLLPDTALLVASCDELDSSKDGASEAELELPIVTHKKMSIFTLHRKDGSLASVRYEVSKGGANSAALRVDDCDTVEVSQSFLPTGLTVFGGRGFELFRELIEDLSMDFSKLKTLEFGCMPGDLLTVLMYFQQVLSRCPTLTRLNLWDFNGKIMRGFNLPLQDLNLLDQPLSAEQLPSLQNLFHASPTLSRVKLSVLSISEAFEIVNYTAQIHKHFSRALLIAKKSCLSVQFTVGTGEVQAITLRIQENELGRLLKLHNVTELDVGFVMDLTRIKEISDSVFSHYRQLRTLTFGCGLDQLLPAVSMLNQAANRNSAECRLVLMELDVDSPRIKERVLELPLKTLDIASYEVNYKHLVDIQNLVRARPMLQELYVSAMSIEVVQQIFNLVVQERLPMSTLSIRLQDGSTAEFSLEATSEKGPMIVVQKISHMLNATFFLPEVELARVDVVDAHIRKHQAAEIAIFVMRYCCSVKAIRFINLPNEVQDVAIIIKDCIQYGPTPRPLKMAIKGEYDDSYNNNNTKNNTGSGSSGNDIDNNNDSSPTVSVQGAGLAVYCALSDDSDARKETSSSPADNVRSSSIVRIQQDGRLEAIGLYWTCPDGATLWLQAVTFEESDFARLADVTDLKVSFGHDSPMIDRLIHAPVNTFSGLKRLELPCQQSLNVYALLEAMGAAIDHPSLKQIQIWHLDHSSTRTTYSLPITTLVLDWHVIRSNELSVLQKIPAIAPSLLVLNVEVFSILEAFKFVRSNMETLGSLTEMHLCDTKGKLSVWFKSGGRGGRGVTREMVSAVLSLEKLEELIPMRDVPVLAMIGFSEDTLALIGAVQEATVDIPDRPNLVLIDRKADSTLAVSLPFTKLDLSKRPMSLKEVKSFKKLLKIFSLLTELHLTLSSVPDLLEAFEFAKLASMQFKKLKVCVLRLRNGTEASFRFSERDGGVDSAALTIKKEFSADLVDVPMVKKVIIDPKVASHWVDIGRTRLEVTRILRLYSKFIETLEFEFGVRNPLPVLSILRDLVQRYPSRPFRRFRHRSLVSGYSPLTYDFPLRELALEVSTIREDPCSLEKLISESPYLSDLMVTVPTDANVDSVLEELKELTVGYGQLSTLSVRSNDGYVRLLRLRDQGLLNKFQDGGLLISRPSEIQVVRTELPSRFPGRGSRKITIAPTAIDHAGHRDYSGEADGMLAIVANSSRKHQDPKLMVVACPMEEFFDFLTAALSQRSLRQLHLHDPADNRVVFTTTISFGIITAATVCVDKISDQDLIKMLRQVFSHFILQVEVVQSSGEIPEVSVRVWRGLTNERGPPFNAFHRIDWDTENVSGLRVFHLLDKLCNGNETEDHIPFNLILKTSHNDSDTVPRPPRPFNHPANSKMAIALTKLLVRRATELRLEYEALKVLIPFVMKEINKKNAEDVGAPFSRLREYNIDVEQSSKHRQHMDEFESILPSTVKRVDHQHSLSETTFLSKLQEYRMDVGKISENMQHINEFESIIANAVSRVEQHNLDDTVFHSNIWDQRPPTDPELHRVWKIFSD
ncbi:hypothetical protein BGZ96_005266 [Linnemannia gamsii]|uniref:Uncharacterized protein n=1 Tax=Linnemannia gamsii TaxID=64522 RepID=A0ABQ7K5U9_9FUNG|nr:hypothetical protein BGZ96_005266 [Linnemannia gamsii]